jgi:hypothetical protein
LLTNPQINFGLEGLGLQMAQSHLPGHASACFEKLVLFSIFVGTFLLFYFLPQLTISTFFIPYTGI